MFTHCPPKTLQNLETVQIDNRRLYVLPDGSKVPSVTTVLGATQKQSLIDWKKRVGIEEANRVSRIATNRGHKIHSMCEAYLNNKPIIEEVMPDVRETFMQFSRVLDKHVDNIHYQEQTLWSPSLQLAGRVDLIAEFDGELTVLDFKTSRSTKKSADILDYYCQCTAYALMYEELIGVPIKQIGIIMSMDDHIKPTVFLRKTKNYVKDLLEYIETYYDTIITT